jgi:MHS family proline/betaine transporter-like MFS transporter
MGLGVLIVAVAPPYVVLGAGAAFLLLLGRLLQGFSAGGEIGRAAAYLVEHAPADRRGLYASWLQASMAAWNLMSAVIGFTITSLLTAQQIIDWAWRIRSSSGC